LRSGASLGRDILLKMDEPPAPLENGRLSLPRLQMRLNTQASQLLAQVRTPSSGRGLAGLAQGNYESA